MKLLHTKLKDLGNEELELLFEELQKVRKVSPEQLSDFSVYHFLQQSLDPFGTGKARALNKKEIERFDDFSNFVLLSKVKFASPAVHSILQELVTGHDDHIENYHDHMIFSMINKFMKPPKRKQFDPLDFL